MIYILIFGLGVTTGGAVGVGVTVKLVHVAGLGMADSS